MNKSLARWLIALSLPGFVVGGMMLKFIYQGYRSSEAMMGVALFSAASLFMGLGVGALTKKKVVGLVIFLGGAGAAFGVLKLSLAKEADMMAGFEREGLVQRAAVGVCTGKPNTALVAPAPGAVRKIMQAGASADSESGTLYGSPWPGLPKPETEAELAVVACLVWKTETVASCSYANAQGQHAYFISKVRYSHVITVRDAKTLAVLGEKTFVGGTPSDKCDESVRTSQNDGSSRTVSGDPPSADEELAFLKTFVFPAEK